MERNQSVKIVTLYIPFRCNTDGGIHMMKIPSRAEKLLTVNTWEAPAYMSCKHQLQLDGEKRCNDCPQHPA